VRSLIFVTMIVTAVISASELESAATWVPGDARPEAIIVGAALLMLAAALRDFTTRRSKPRS
jgi:hypothetical protein